MCSSKLKLVALLKNNYSTSCHIIMGMETNYRKIKIEAFINYKSTIVAQNNVLLGVTWMCPSKLKMVTPIEE